MSLGRRSFSLLAALAVAVGAAATPKARVTLVRWPYT